MAQWKFVQGVTEYDFAINPNKMSSPLRRFTTEPRADGSAHRGQRTPIELTISGVLNTEAQYEAFREWVYDVDGRVELHTHLGQVYEVRLLQFLPKERRRSRLNAWRFEWQLRCLVYT